MNKEVTVKMIAKRDCTGCSVCANKCPVDAIQMKENEEGFLYPFIDEDKCISCGACLNACAVHQEPTRQNDNPKVFAAQANDDVRMESSSGGVFSVLASKIIDEGGYVCGAAYSDDFRSVNHIIINDKDSLQKLRGSKYVQSIIGDVYKEIQTLLRAGKKVLFSGTPCQVAGARKFFGDNENLITVDIVCHGIPSPKSYRLFLDTVVTERSENKDIKEFSFRNKHKHGWSHSVYAKMGDGYEYDKGKYETPWYNAFINILNCRESCGNCRFNKIPRQGDITLADFWAIEELPKEWDDGKGTSIVCANSLKGEVALNSISEEIKILETEIDVARKHNGNLVGSSKSHKNRNRFFELVNKGNDFEKATEYAIKRKFDIGYVGWWYGINYGSVLTNFALWNYLNSLDYTILMLDWPLEYPTNDPIPDSFARRFANKHYEISMRRTYDELYNLNWFCDTFVVGSDQLWNYWSTKKDGSYFFLNFVEDTKKKIAYSTSFGHPSYDAPKHLLKETGYHMSRFDAVSVREKDGVDICKETFGVDAVQTIDPVFLNEASVYESLCDGLKVDKENYIFAYILSPTEEKRETLIELAKRLNKDIVLILDADGDREGNKRVMNMPECLIENPELEEWVNYIRNADYVFTDSFHGVCFSIIFEKQFSCVANVRRGLSRFKTIMGTADIMDNMVLDSKDIISKEIYNKVIDYNHVNGLLKPEIERSKEWLKHALKTNKPHTGSGYDLLVDRLRELENRVKNLEQK
ncbi:Coenzyme F420-reducing hydrogenase, beta subunit [Lachnospiraceae bacterium A10]|nr:Coenzyme F420-reducing hydrogenase, beta subunit [Lachnospiraceae bacterium A10]